MINALFALHIVITIVSAAIAYLTGYAHYKYKNPGVRNFALFYVMIFIYGLVMVGGLATQNPVLISWAHLCARVAIFIAIIFITKTAIFTTTLKVSGILPVIRVLMALGAVATIYISVGHNDPATILADGNIIWNTAPAAAWLIGASTAIAGVMWALLIYVNILGPQEMTKAVKLKAHILALAGLFIGIGYSLFFVPTPVEFDITGIWLVVIGYTAKLAVFSLWKYLRLDETSRFRDVV